MAGRILDAKIHRPGPRLRRLAAAAVALGLVAPAGSAQEGIPLPDSLGAGYAQLVNITLSEALSSAHYTVVGEGGTPDGRIGITRLPWRVATTGAGAGEIDWIVQLGYQTLKARFPLEAPELGSGAIDSKWTTLGADVGVRYRLPVGRRLSLEPALWLGAVRLENDARYFGIGEVLRPELDNRLFNWDTRATLATADLGLVGRREWGRRQGLLSLRATRSRISSFDESNEVLEFTEAANTLSLRGELEGPTGRAIGGRDVGWIAHGGYLRFFGENDDALGFNDVVELGGGFALPANLPRLRMVRVALSASIFYGKDLRGWSVGVGLRDR